MKNEENDSGAIRWVASVLGSLVGISALDHGILEILQGNIPIDGVTVFAVPAGNTWSVWSEGTEPAFTIIPNCLITGIVATLMGILITVWSIWFIHKRHGVLVFLLLAVGVFLFGGGYAQVLYVLLTLYVASHIGKPLHGWRRLLPPKLRQAIMGWWRPLLVVVLVLYVVALEIAVFGYVPGVTDHDLLLYICWACLGLGILLLLVAFVSAVSHDLEQRDGEQLAMVE